MLDTRKAEQQIESLPPAPSSKTPQGNNSTGWREGGPRIHREREEGRACAERTAGIRVLCSPSPHSARRLSARQSSARFLSDSVSRDPRVFLITPCARCSRISLVTICVSIRPPLAKGPDRVSAASRGWLRHQTNVFETSRYKHTRHTSHALFEQSARTITLPETHVCVLISRVSS